MMNKYKLCLSEGKCPTGWHRRDYFCYRAVCAELTFSAAAEHCKTLNRFAYLASLHSTEEALFAALVATDAAAGCSSYPVWIGLKSDSASREYMSTAA